MTTARMNRQEAMRRMFLRFRAGPASKTPVRLQVQPGILGDSRRPLLFGLLPRMIETDGTTPESLQHAFRYVEQYHHGKRVLPVSLGRWKKALALSQKLADRRSARRPR